MTEEQRADAEALRKKTYHSDQELREKARLTEKETLKALNIPTGSRHYKYAKEQLAWATTGAEAQLDKAISIIREEIEKIPNPYSCRLDIPRCIGFDKAKQDILSKLREVNNDG